MSKIVKKTDNISSIVNGQFVYCKELNKGFIKRDISSLGVVTFEDVITTIEGMTEAELVSSGLDSVIFHENRSADQGTIQSSLRLQKVVDKTISNLKESEAVIYANNLSKTSRYFNFDLSTFTFGNNIKIFGTGVTEGYTVEVYNKDILLGSDLVGVDTAYEIIIDNLDVGFYALTIKILKPDGTIDAEFVSETEVYDKDIAEAFADGSAIPKTAENIKGTTTPNTDIIVYNKDGDIVGTTVSDENGIYEVKPVGLKSTDTLLDIVIDDVTNTIETNPIDTVFNPTIPPVLVDKTVYLAENPEPTPTPNLGESFDTTGIVPDEVKTDTIIPTDETALLNDIEIPVMHGTVLEAYSIVYVLVNGIIVGKTIANRDLSFTVYLYGLIDSGIDLTQSLNIEIKIEAPAPLNIIGYTITEPIGINGAGETLGQKSFSMTLRDSGDLTPGWKVLATANDFTVVYDTSNNTVKCLFPNGTKLVSNFIPTNTKFNLIVNPTESKIYIDAVDNSNIYDISWGPDYQGAIRIGNGYYDSFTGEVFDFQLFTYDIPTDKISVVANGGSTTNLFARYNFTSDTPYIDISGNGNDLSVK